MTSNLNQCLIAILLVANCAFALDNFNIEKVGNALFSPSTFDFEIRDNYAYCVNIYGLSVWDISNPEDMTRISCIRTPGSATRLCLYDDYAYISDQGRGIAVVEISDPENPHLVNQVDMDIYQVRVSPSPDLAVHDDLLYICGGGEGYYVASLEDPTNPEVIQDYSYGNHFTHEFLFTDETTYLLSYDTFILDTEDPANIEIIDTLVVGGWDFDIHQNTLAIFGRDELSFFSIENPNQPEPIGMYEFQRGQREGAVKINDNFAYSIYDLRIDAFKFGIIDISNPEEAEITGEITLNGEKLDYKDDVVYVSSYRKGLLSISVQDPTDPVVINEQQIEYFTTDFSIYGDYAYLWDEELVMLRVVDISNPAEPELVAECEDMARRDDPWDHFAFYDNYLYIVNGSGTTIVDISDPNSPEIETELGMLAGGIRSPVEVVGDYLYFTRLMTIEGRHYNLAVYDLADPLDPELVFFTNDFRVRWNNSAEYYKISDGRLYQRSDGGTDEMLIYSLDDPAEPELIGYWGEGEYYNFFVYNSYIYNNIRDDDGRTLQIIDAENPEEPEIIGSVEFPYTLQDAYIDGEIVCCKCRGMGVICLSLDDPLNPEIVGYYDTPGQVEQIIACDDNIYVADNIEFGVYQLDFEPGQDADFTIELNRGWNLVSAPFIPENNDIEDLFERLVGRDNLFMVKDHDGRFYIPDQNFNNIPNWDFRQGYQVKVDRADVIWIQGDEVAPNTQIDLREGWSMAAYFPEQDVDAFTAFGNIENSLLLAKDDMGHFYSPEFNFSNMGDLRRGKGYQIKTSEETQLVWNVEQRVNA